MLARRRIWRPRDGVERFAKGWCSAASRNTQGHLRFAALIHRYPLESRVDSLTLSTAKRIQVPFEQLIIFSTNLEPRELQSVLDPEFL